MLLKRLLIVLSLVMVLPRVHADSLNVELSSESARLIYATELYGSQYGPIDLEFGGFFDQNDDFMVTAGLLVRNDTLDSPLVISIGTKLYYGDAGNAPGQTQADIGALTIGGELLYFPKHMNGIGFGAFVYVAPKIVSFMDADGFIEYGARAEYEITKQASFYVGYANAEANLKNGGDVEIEQGFFIGIGMRF